MLAPLTHGVVRRALDALEPLAPALGGPAPKNDRGVALDPRCHLLVSLLARGARPPLDELGPVRARTELRAQMALADLPKEPLHRIEDRAIPGPGGPLPLRLYTPRSGPDPLPAIVYFHGGGFVLGDLESHDAQCRHLARHAGAAVIAVDYRLAPEHPFPAAVDDCVAAFRWVAAHTDELRLDPARLAVGGDSAGGNLAAVVAQATRGDLGPRPAWQLLIYPATDMTRSCESHELFAEGFFLTRATMDWFVASYLTDPSEERDPRASPLATRELAGLPPAHVIVAGFDPLRDEGEAYAHALMAAGVPTTLRCYGSLVHGFYGMGGLVEAARWAAGDIAEVTRRALWP
ncbi:MAG: alpha/beta hydrolase [Sandaracinaceae bacterium]|nr:alpha/beta hydrolase [Sandaracinaceae bacterium]